MARVGILDLTPDPLSTTPSILKTVPWPEPVSTWLQVWLFYGSGVSITEKMGFLFSDFAPCLYFY